MTSRFRQHIYRQEAHDDCPDNVCSRGWQPGNRPRADNTCAQCHEPDVEEFDESVAGFHTIPHGSGSEFDVEAVHRK